VWRPIRFRVLRTGSQHARLGDQESRVAFSEIRTALETSGSVAKRCIAVQDQPSQIALIYAQIKQAHQWQGKLPGIDMEILCAKEGFTQCAKHGLSLARRIVWELRLHATPHAVVDAGEQVITKAPR
jgi:hypothetical protein